MSAPPVQIWPHLGFEDTPYSTLPLLPVARDARLLAGREAALDEIKYRLVNDRTMIPLQGDFGVGKSSVANVAAWYASTWRKQGPQIYIPVAKPFVLDIGTLAEFPREVYRRVARALISGAEALADDYRGLARVDDMKDWISAPIIRAGGGGGTAFGFGGQFSVTKAINATDAMEEDGLRAIVTEWLDSAFGDDKPGAVICVLDNMETLGSGRTVAQLIEAHRDSLFTANGLRWILCGAERIFDGISTRRKLHGFFSDPIEIGPLSDDEAREVVSRRIHSLALPNMTQLVPVTPDKFESVYLRTGKNLRFALNICHNFALHVGRDVAKVGEPSRAELDSKLADYLAERARRAADVWGRKLPPAQATVLDTLMSQFGGSCSSNDWREFSQYQSAFSNAVTKLKEKGLVERVDHPEAGGRSLITATELGRWAYFSQRQEP